MAELPKSKEEQAKAEEEAEKAKRATIEVANALVVALGFNRNQSRKMGDQHVRASN